MIGKTRRQGTRSGRPITPVAVVLLFAALCVAQAGDYSSKGVERDQPKLALSGEGREYWESGFNGVYPELFNNLKNPSPPFDTRYAQPGPAWPDTVFLWDTAFISEVWRLWDVDTAKEINLAVLDHHKDGMLQHQHGRLKKSDDTQPPVMAWSVTRNHAAASDREYLERAYEVLVKYNRWLRENRRHPSGLFFWKHPFESGMDNSPRFTNRAVTRTDNMEELAAADLSSFVVLQERCLARMARNLGRDGEAGEFDKAADSLRELINRELWDPEAGIYFDKRMDEGRIIRIKTIAGLLPLFCGVPSREQAARLRDHIMDPAEFNTAMPLPSVARDEESYFLDMWRGPVWINTSYMIVLGLEDYGYNEEAADIAFRTVDRVYRDRELTGEYWEFYDPEKPGIGRLHRKTSFFKRGMADKPRPHFVGWTGLVNNLVVEHLMATPEGRARLEKEGL